MTTLPEKALLTVSEVAEYFGVTSKTIRNWLKSNRLRGIKKGSTLRVYRASIEEKEGDCSIPSE
jgi:excisionase family DNA binding protein